VLLTTGWLRDLQMSFVSFVFFVSSW